MGFVDYERNDRATAAYLKRNADLADAVGAAAEDVAAEAEYIVASEAYETGALLASIRTERSDTRDRVGYAVLADDPAAAPRQFGNVRASNPEEYLTRAAALVGLDVKGGGA
jgi:hypothetical protein